MYVYTGIFQDTYTYMYLRILTYYKPIFHSTDRKILYDFAINSENTENLKNIYFWAVRADSAVQQCNKKFGPFNKHPRRYADDIKLEGYPVLLILWKYYLNSYVGYMTPVPCPEVPSSSIKKIPYLNQSFETTVDPANTDITGFYVIWMRQLM